VSKRGRGQGHVTFF